MFQSIDFHGLSSSKAFAYAADIPFFKGRKTLEFKPGLNILFGPNGCGKSTILQILGKTMCATQGGISAITETGVHEGVDMPFGRIGQPRPPKTSKVGLQVAHDGQPVIFCDPRATVGLAGGHFDDDFFSAGVTEATSRRRASHGQASLSRLDAALGILRGRLQFPKEVIVKMDKRFVNDVWAESIEVLERQMAGTIELGQPTVLLDEPEANFSLLWQSRLWQTLTEPKVAETFQVIVATHSPFALAIPGANYIDLEPGYRQQILRDLCAHFAPVIESRAWEQLPSAPTAAAAPAKSKRSRGKARA